jgi:hypothetical protein
VSVEERISDDEIISTDLITKGGVRRKHTSRNFGTVVKYLGPKRIENSTLRQMIPETSFFHLYHLGPSAPLVAEMTMESQRKPPLIPRLRTAPLNTTTATIISENKDQEVICSKEMT